MGKNPPREAMMNHESSGYPLPLSRANNATHMPTSWQGIHTPAMPPRKWERRVSSSHSWGLGPPVAWSLQGPLGFPQAEKRSVRSQLWASGPKLQTLSQSAACSKASSAGTSPLPPLQGKTPEPAGRICATKQLPQGHYVSPVYLPTVNPQPSGIKMNCSPAHLDPSPVSLRPEVPTKSRDTRKW